MAEEDGGNQFSVEPPDQGLCGGNGYVMESVNDVLRIYSTSGTAKTGVIDLNTFYNYYPAINRSGNPLTFGPDVTDPSCYYHPDTQRWFQVALTLDWASLTSQSLAGTNHLDIAVSQTADPTESWTIYRLPVQNDGTQGKPGHPRGHRAESDAVVGDCHRAPGRRGRSSSYCAPVAAADRSGGGGRLGGQPDD